MRLFVCRIDKKVTLLYEFGGMRFVIVRDLLSGSVLFVGKGKGGNALKKFRKRLKRKAHQIKGVAMDMSNAYLNTGNTVH